MWELSHGQLTNFHFILMKLDFKSQPSSKSLFQDYSICNNARLISTRFLLPCFDPNEWYMNNGHPSGGLNPRPLSHESSALTTRPRLLDNVFDVYFLAVCFMSLLLTFVCLFIPLFFLFVHALVSALFSVFDFVVAFLFSVCLHRCCCLFVCLFMPLLLFSCCSFLFAFPVTLLFVCLWLSCCFFVCLFQSSVWATCTEEERRGLTLIKSSFISSKLLPVFPYLSRLLPLYLYFFNF
jgi:hypothetical protein